MLFIEIGDMDICKDTGTLYKLQTSDVFLADQIKHEVPEYTLVFFDLLYGIFFRIINN